MARTLAPLEAGALLRLLTVDAGRTLTPEEGELIGLALAHLADAVDNSTAVPGITSGGPAHRTAGYAEASSLELRQLANQLHSTAGLAAAMADRPEGSTFMRQGVGF